MDKAEDDIGFYFEQGKSLIAQGRISEAKVAFHYYFSAMENSGIEEPDYYKEYEKVGDVIVKIDPELALKYYKKAIRLFSRHYPNSRFLKSSIKLQLAVELYDKPEKGFFELIELVESIAKENPNSSAPSNIYGRLFEIHEQYSLSFDLFNYFIREVDKCLKKDCPTKLLFYTTYRLFSSFIDKYYFMLSDQSHRHKRITKHKNFIFKHLKRYIEAQMVYQRVLQRLKETREMIYTTWMKEDISKMLSTMEIYKQRFITWKVYLHKFYLKKSIDSMVSYCIDNGEFNSNLFKQLVSQIY